MVEKLCGTRPGYSWMPEFKKRHKDLKHSRYLQRMSKERADAVKSKNLDRFFNIYAYGIDKYSVKSIHLYNLDEKGVIIGGTQKRILYWVARSMNDENIKDPALAQPVWRVTDPNRELITIIKCISAAGNVVPPMLVYKGRQIMAL